jgi:hypothetical protein
VRHVGRPAGAADSALLGRGKGRDQQIEGIETDAIDGLSVSPDGRSIVFGRNRPASDLMMIENFR